MTEFIPYFAGIITLIFGVAFVLAVVRLQNEDSEVV